MKNFKEQDVKIIFTTQIGFLITLICQQFFMVSFEFLFKNVTHMNTVPIYQGVLVASFIVQIILLVRVIKVSNLKLALPFIMQSISFIYTIYAYRNILIRVGADLRMPIIIAWANWGVIVLSLVYFGIFMLSKNKLINNSIRID